MAPTTTKKRPSAARSEDYESDNGFVEDAPPRSKKSKTSVSKPANASSSSSSRGATKSIAGRGGGALVDDNGDVYWELSRLRRITISEFKGKRMVNVREYYEKEGAVLPGKKVGQFSSLVCLLSANMT